LIGLLWAALGQLSAMSGAMNGVMTGATSLHLRSQGTTAIYELAERTSMRSTRILRGLASEAVVVAEAVVAGLGSLNVVEIIVMHQGLAAGTETTGRITMTGALTEEVSMGQVLTVLVFMAEVEGSRLDPRLRGAAGQPGTVACL
jgi:hypothetical protein